MGQASTTPWLIVLAVLTMLLIGIGYPVFRILGRMGLPRWWTLLALIPYVNIVALWLVALVRWPRLDDASASRATQL